MPRQPFQNLPSTLEGGWCHGQQKNCWMTTSRNGHPCKCQNHSQWPPAQRLEENLCWIIRHVPLMTPSFKGLNYWVTWCKTSTHNTYFSSKSYIASCYVPCVTGSVIGRQKLQAGPCQTLRWVLLCILCYWVLWCEWYQLKPPHSDSFLQHLNGEKPTVVIIVWGLLRKMKDSIHEHCYVKVQKVKHIKSNIMKV